MNNQSLSINKNKDESLKIYCSSAWKKKISRLAELDNKSMSSFIIENIDLSLDASNNIINISTDQLQRIERLTIKCFEVLFQNIDAEEAFHEILKTIYTEESKNEK